jgi:hypothetical protein
MLTTDRFCTCSLRRRRKEEEKTKFYCERQQILKHKNSKAWWLILSKNIKKLTQLQVLQQNSHPNIAWSSGERNPKLKNLE